MGQAIGGCLASTDYSTLCDQLPQSFIQMLANCIFKYEGHYVLNLLTCTDYCDDLEDFWTCANNGIEPERALVENLFALDECGRLGIKIFINLGKEPS